MADKRQPDKAKTQHLLTRKGRHWARLAVPEALRPIVGKRELTEPLGADLTLARRKLPGAVARMQERLERARAERAGDQKVVESILPRNGRVLSVRNLARTHFENEMALHEVERRADRSSYAETIRFQEQHVMPVYLTQLRKVVAGLTSNEEANAIIGWKINDFQSNGNTMVEFGTPEWRELSQALAGVHLETVRLQQARAAGDFAAMPQHPLLVEKPAASDPLCARVLGPDSERTLTDLGEQFTKERAVSDRTRHDNRVTLRMLGEAIGDDLPVYRLTRQHVHSFKRMLSEAPTSYALRFPGLTLPDAVKANAKRKAPFPILDARTVNDKYLARLHAFLNWAVSADIIPDNPSAGIKVEQAPKSQPPRVNFDSNDLARLFGANFPRQSLWGEFEWAMLMSLFGGYRASELAQVRLTSVRTERGVLVVAIEEQTKNRGSQRLVPVHTTLTGFGFENYVAGLRARKQSHLFPSWYQRGMQAKANAPTEGAMLDHYFPRYIPRKFNVTYRATVGITDDRKTWHSFRHTFKSGLKMAGVPKDMRDELAGHSDQSAGAGYEHGAPVEAMRAAIEQLRYDGFPLT